MSAERAPARASDKSSGPSIEPDHYWQDGAIPVFKPTWDEFKSFPDFIARIDHHGMKSGIVKVIPPKEWLDLLPDLDEKVKDVRVRSAIEQNFAGSGGAFKQMNIEKQRSYNLVQWRKICDSSEHQPPARRGEVRQLGGGVARASLVADSRKAARERPKRSSTGADAQAREGCKKSDDFADFDYRIYDNDKYTAERCQELEKAYWKSLTYNQPMYGADLPGSLFDDSVKEWNVAHLDNILNRLGKVLPGVNSAYLYLGMWKASFSWHVEDMDLYSINYIHFGAPKQWYSISQADNNKFEKVMRDIFPSDARHCSQFMRHKTFGASPTKLAQHGVEVNRLVHYEKEFVITFPYGYHSGYNLGYNCAESVNFATQEWLEFGKVAEKCECIHDAVSIDVDEIIQQVNTDATKHDLPTPPASEDGESPKAELPKTSVKTARRATKRSATTIEGYQRIADAYHDPPSLLKRVKLSINTQRPNECALCPNTRPKETIAPFADGSGRSAHWSCAQFVPETRLIEVPGITQISARGYDDIPKARFKLRCAHCKQSGGACFQCSAPRCVKAYHGTCAMAAGVLIQRSEITVDHEDDFTFACKTHRQKRPPSEQLEFDKTTTEYCSALRMGMLIQLQVFDGPVFAGRVLDNRRSERALLVERTDLEVNCSDPVEVDYKWVLAGSTTQFGDPAELKVHSTDSLKVARVPHTQSGTSSKPKSKPKARAAKHAAVLNADSIEAAHRPVTQLTDPASPVSLERSPSRSVPGVHAVMPAMASGAAAPIMYGQGTFRPVYAAMPGYQARPVTAPTQYGTTPPTWQYNAPVSSTYNNQSAWMPMHYNYGIGPPASQQYYGSPSMAPYRPTSG